MAMFRCLFRLAGLTILFLLLVQTPTLATTLKGANSPDNGSKKNIGIRRLHPDDPHEGHGLRDEDDNVEAVICSSGMPARPDYRDKPRMARWMAHTLNWGILSTISTRASSPSNEQPTIPFGNIYSFVDGPCTNSTGIPYFYTSNLDQSMKDVKKNRHVSFTLTEAAASNMNMISACRIEKEGFGDPMNPPCARLVLSGTFVPLRQKKNKEERDFAMEALYQRHPAMRYWPKNHRWYVAKINITELWLIDIFGGASIIDLEDYLSVDLLHDDNSRVENELLTEGEVVVENEEKPRQRSYYNGVKDYYKLFFGAW